MEFEWDENKNKANIKKHGVPLVSGQYVFDDVHRIENIDDRHDYGEFRWFVIGQSGTEVLFVVYTMREDVVRLISVRSTTKKERRLYYGNYSDDF